MQLIPSRIVHLDGAYKVLKAPDVDGPPAQRDPKVVATVSEMLSAIEKGGMDTVLAYARKLDNWPGGDLEVDLAASVTGELPEKLRAALDLGAARTRAFAALTREKLVDFEAELVPGLTVGHRYVPIARVGASLPAGRFPLRIEPR